MNTITERRCYTCSTKGEPADVLSELHKIPVPEVDEDEVLVHVKATGFNYGCYKMMAIVPNFIVKKPNTPEIDYSGIVYKVGAKAAEEFRVGDEVIGTLSLDAFMKKQEGALTELVKTNTRTLHKKPENMSMVAAAAIASTGLTIYDGLCYHYKLKEGDRIFVNGGSGGVGHLAVQVAKALVGPTGFVVSSCSTANVEFVKSLGADEVIDYKAGSVPEQLAERYGSAPFDVIYDTVGSQDIFNASPKYLKQEGPFVSIVFEFRGFGSFLKATNNMLCNKYLPRILGGVPRKFIFYPARDTKEGLEATYQWASEGKIRVVIDSEYAFEDRNSVLQAYQRIMSGRTKGKVVVVNRSPLGG